jgi:hypothetical protein
MATVRPEDRCGIDGQGNDADIVLIREADTEPTWDVRQARTFGRRGDQRAFEKWLCQQTSDANTWKKLREEFNRARDEHQPIEAWRKIWREGLVPQLSTDGLQGLLDALKRNDSRIITGATTEPPAFSAASNLPIERCDPIIWAMLDGHGPAACTVGLMDEAFARLAIRCSELCGMPRAIGTLLCWIDDQDRETWRTELMREIHLALIGRLPEETPLCKQLRASIAAVERNGRLS